MLWVRTLSLCCVCLCNTDMLILYCHCSRQCFFFLRESVLGRVFFFEINYFLLVLSIFRHRNIHLCWSYFYRITWYLMKHQKKVMKTKCIIVLITNYSSHNDFTCYNHTPLLHKLQLFLLLVYTCFKDVGDQYQVPSA